MSYLHLSEVEWLKKGSIVKRPGITRSNPLSNDNLDCTFFLLIINIDPSYRFASALRISVIEDKLVDSIAIETIGDVIREDWYGLATDEERSIALPLFAAESQRMAAKYEAKHREWIERLLTVASFGAELLEYTESKHKEWLDLALTATIESLPDKEIGAALTKDDIQWAQIEIDRIKRNGPNHAEPIEPSVNS